MIPFFGNTLINEIYLNQLDQFRQQLTEMEKEDGNRALSNAHVNNILWPLISIRIVAAEEFKFDYPFSRYRALREQKADSSPMTLQEVKRFLDYIEPEWYDHFLLRFMTGMRSCEVHGLQLKHIDFDHRLIKVRQNVVNGEITDVKTPKSRRDLPINDILSSSLERITATLTEPDDFLFTNDASEPLDIAILENKYGTRH
ncbi:tyrosine-type recombinase/integrase [Photobacterium leiognathi]|uniref:tyrosine-type recombinase/integrase n=1 Tax=Photobacterium leiognathi TaxID=553611 RepID=UPI002982A8FB|nr:tyrosine-type recombinase/integrase [Photobacterium leiognathi]